MSGAEVLVVLPIVFALISAFKDSTELGQKTRKWWKTHVSRDRHAAKAAAEQDLDQSLIISPQRIQQEYTQGFNRYGQRFRVGDDTARMELMWCLLNMHQDMLKTCQLMLDNRVEYDPSRLLRTSNGVRDRSLDSFHSLAQRLEIEAPISPPLNLYPRRDGRADAVIREQLPSRFSRVNTLSDPEDNNQIEEEGRRLNAVARNYTRILPDPTTSPMLSQSPLDLSTEFNAFCPGPVEESFSSGSRSLWQCHKCGHSISFDYNKIDRSRPFANLIFSCHLPTRSETVSYKCVICREIGEPQNTMVTFDQKLDLVEHLGDHTAQDFKKASFDESILYDSCRLP